MTFGEFRVFRVFRVFRGCVPQTTEDTELTEIPDTSAETKHERLRIIIRSNTQHASSWVITRK
jgi:hypothetical protein